MVLRGLENTSVTAVLIGYETAARPYVIYEIIESFNGGKGLLGVYIDGIEDKNGRIDLPGANPLAHVQTQREGRTVLLSSLFRTYDWEREDGYNNFGSWVEDATQRATPK